MNWMWPLSPEVGKGELRIQHQKERKTVQKDYLEKGVGQPV